MEEGKRIIIRNISKEFKIGFKKNQGALARFVSLFSGRSPRKVLQVLKGISFEVKTGEIFGVIGANGSGKSTLLRIVSGIYKSKGRVYTNGKIISLIGLNHALKENLKMKDNIYLSAALFGFDRQKVNEKYNSIVDFSGLKDFENTKLFQFSEGMKQRIAFSIAIHCNPQILLLDEVFSVGDEGFKIKCEKKIKKLVENGISVLFVTHDLYSVKKYCKRAMWLDKGNVVKIGEPEEVCDSYLKSLEQPK